MEPFVILAIAAIAVVVFFLVWNNRSRQSRSRPEDTNRLTGRNQDTR